MTTCMTSGVDSRINPLILLCRNFAICVIVAACKAD